MEWVNRLNAYSNVWVNSNVLKYSNVCPEIGAFSIHLQARNQLWTLQGKSFLRGAQFFKTMSSSFKLRPTSFLKGGFALLVTVLPTWGPIVSQSLHLPCHTKPLQPSQSKVLWTKERDDIRRQTSKHLGSGCLRFILPLLSQSDKKGPAWNHSKYTRLA